MPAPRAWRLDLAAFLLLLAGAAIAFGFGSPGAWLAAALRDALGLAVHAWLAFWLAGVVALWRRRDWASWLPRLAGFLLLVPACAALCHALGGDGGAIGEFLDIHLRRLPPFWRSVALIGSALAGLSL